MRPFAGMVKCPHPDCTHIGEVITKVHCRTIHGMERDKMFKKYGTPQPPAVSSDKMKKYNDWRKSENSKYSESQEKALQDRTGVKKGQK